MTLTCSGTQAGAQRASTRTPETVELTLTEALVLCDLDL